MGEKKDFRPFTTMEPVRGEHPATLKGKAACSFCNKRPTFRKDIVMGPGVCICRECVDMCKEILDKMEAGL